MKDLITHYFLDDLVFLQALAFFAGLEPLFLRRDLVPADFVLHH
jgi:hypothetical protein